MKTLRTAFFALFVIALVAAPPVQAQTPWELGPYLGLNFDSEELLLGAVGRIHLPSAPVTLNPAVEFYPSLGTDVSLLVLNFDVQYQLEAESFEPYIGGGISMARFTEAGAGDWDAGINLKGGLLFNRRGSAQPYLEAVLNFDDGSDPFILKTGLLFRIGG